MGNVADRADKALGLALGVEQQATTRLDPAIVAVAMTQAVGVFARFLAGALQQLLEGLCVMAVVIGVQVLQPDCAAIAQFLRLQAEQGGVAGRVEHPLGAQIPVP
ncbi:hypothetical protein D9M68_742530 [compost metagenome]